MSYEIRKAYYDLFADKFVKKKDPIAPPERYMKYEDSAFDGHKIEEWEVMKNGMTYRLSIAYEKNLTSEQINIIRQTGARKNGCELTKLLCVRYDKEDFDKYIEKAE